MPGLQSKRTFLILLAGAIFAATGATAADDRGGLPGSIAFSNSIAASPTVCGRTYLNATRNISCQALADFQRNCPGELYGALAETALRLRCPDQYLDQKVKIMRQEFAKLEQQNTCAAANSFSDRYATDFELADAPEIEKANVLRIKLCEEEARAKELAALEAGLRNAIVQNDCADFRALEKQFTLKLSPDQSNRLTAASRQRCDFEDRTRATLRSCLEKNETAGNFCGGTACYRSFRDALPDKYFTPYRSDADRQEKICREYNTMRTCFSNDPCDGDRCSFPLRLAVGNGVLMSHIEKNEKDAVQACKDKRERPTKPSSPPWPAPASPSPQNNPSVDFVLTNNAAEEVNVAFFDAQNSALLAPEQGRRYVQSAGATRTYSVTCTTGQMVCYGGSVRSDPLGSSWGAGYSGRGGCTDCCRTCGGIPLRRNLDIASSFTPKPTITWTIENATSRTLSLAFYSDSRQSFGWPKWDRNWTMNRGSNSHTFNCVKDEKVCYGAWPLGNVNGTYWGVGPYRKHRCTNCCGNCNGGTYTGRLVD
jgi:hypothetical protein